jgi:competence protein ComEA
MKKLVTLLVGLGMAVVNVFAAVNVNTATQEQLESLNGIGPAKAKAIIDYRLKNGSFKTLEEIDNVPGLGAGIMGKIKNDVTLTGVTTVKADTSSKNANRDAKKSEKAALKSEKNGGATASTASATSAKSAAKPAEKK